MCGDSAVRPSIAAWVRLKERQGRDQGNAVLGRTAGSLRSKATAVTLDTCDSSVGEVFGGSQGEYCIRERTLSHSGPCQRLPPVVLQWLKKTAQNVCSVR